MWEQPVIEHGVTTRWGWRVDHPQHFVLGKNTDIGFGCYINAKQGVEIQDNVQIGSHCSIYSISTIDGKQGSVLLKKNCKVGTHSVIMPGVTIGENSVIGAFSFVTHSIPDNEMWVCVRKGFRKEI
jgi:acetyltransferase-like isoleucine patch superfamily enzyme